MEILASWPSFTPGPALFKSLLIGSQRLHYPTIRTCPLARGKCCLSLVRYSFQCAGLLVEESFKPEKRPAMALFGFRQLSIVWRWWQKQLFRSLAAENEAAFGGFSKIPPFIRGRAEWLAPSGKQAVVLLDCSIRFVPWRLCSCC